MPHRRVELPSTQSFVMKLLEDKLADFAITDRRKTFVGSKWSIYLSSKLSRNKALSSQNTNVPAHDWGSCSIAADLIDKLKSSVAGGDTSGDLQMIGTDRRAIKSLLETCDSSLLAKWGQEEFAKNVSVLGISLNDWLSIK
jgi:hypothetical protein